MKQTVGFTLTVLAIVVLLATVLRRITTAGSRVRAAWG